MRKSILLPGLAVLGGGLGFVLRWWQWSTAYDPVDQRFISGAFPTYALLGLTALLAALFLVLVRGGGQKPDDFLPAFRCPSTGHMTLLTVSAFLFLGAGLLGLLEGMEQLSLWRAYPDSYVLTYPTALLLCALFCFPAGVSVLLLGKGAYRGTPAPAASLLASFPAFAGLGWLFATHLNHGTDPILMNYGFTLAAAALLMLAHYYIAGFFFGRCHPGRAAFCALLGSVLGLISLADQPNRFVAVLTAAFVLSALAHVRALLRNTFGPPWPKRLLDERMPLGAQDKEETDETTD